jgi:hypothetical protein
MKLLVGIYQEREQVNGCFASSVVAPDAVVEVGPFSSQHQAVEWMEFLGDKMSNCTMAHYSAEERNKRPWYGYATVG